jgi:hypothetical protein
LTVRTRDGDFGPGATVSFAAAGTSEIQTVALSWEDITLRSLDGAWRALVNAAHRGMAVEIEDDGSTLARGEDRPADFAAMLQDPLRVSSVTFAAGFVWWLTRSGGLLTTMLLGIPAWRHVDLLPVLARRLDDEDDEDDDASAHRDPPTRPDDLDDPALAVLFERARAPVARAGSAP